MRHYPALDVIWTVRPDDADIERLLAELDDLTPTAVEDLPAGIRVFFHSSGGCADAAIRLADIDPTAQAVSVHVPDEEWAERSQLSLGPVQVGRIVIAGPEGNDSGSRFRDHTPETTPGVVVLTISRSMGFGTGHHASTRLCVRLLQQVPVAGAAVLDVGTGSGVLAIAAWRLGALPVVAIDSDPDALVSARENVERNVAQGGIVLQLRDLADDWTEKFDLVLANLTGATLARHARQLADLIRPSGRLVASGFIQDEEAAVVHACSAAGLALSLRVHEDEWVALALLRT